MPTQTEYVKARVEYSTDNFATDIKVINIQRLTYREVGAEERIWNANSEDLQSVHFGKRCLEFEFVTKGEVDRTWITPWSKIESPRALRFVLVKPDGTEVNKQLAEPIALLNVDISKGLGGEVLEETWRGVCRGFV